MRLPSGNLARRDEAAAWRTAPPRANRHCRNRVSPRQSAVITTQTDEGNYPGASSLLHNIRQYMSYKIKSAGADWVWKVHRTSRKRPGPPNLPCGWGEV